MRATLRLYCLVLNIVTERLKANSRVMDTSGYAVKCLKPDGRVLDAINEAEKRIIPSAVLLPG